MFCALLGNQQIRLNLSNKKGQTALDTSEYKIPSVFFDDQVIYSFSLFLSTALDAKEINGDLCGLASPSFLFRLFRSVKQRYTLH